VEVEFGDLGEQYRGDGRDGCCTPESWIAVLGQRQGCASHSGRDDVDKSSVGRAEPCRGTPILGVRVAFDKSRGSGQAIAECERALALDRNLADAHAAIGAAKNYMGRSAESEGHVNEALRLSPRDIFALGGS
jgi:tetratricopeptide (TPR) repeat protein